MVSTTATWTGDVVGDENNYNNAGNWTGNDGPPSQTADFDSSGATQDVTVTAFTTVDQWNILDNQNYIFTFNDDFNFNGLGINVDAGSSATITNNATLSFFAGGTAGNAHITTTNGATTQFLGSTAGSARVTVEAGGQAIFFGALDMAVGSIEGSGSFLLGSHLTVLDGNSFTVGGVISGTGPFQLAAGTLFLTGANTYTDGTIIDSGATLVLGDDSEFSGSSTGSIIGDVANNGTLTFNRSNAYQFDGVISGSGGVQTNGTGTITFTAVHTYTGATLINDVSTLVLSGNASIEDSSVIGGFAGALDISTHTGDASIKSLTGDVGVNLGANTLIVTAANHSFNGNLVGTGGLTVTGGTLTITSTVDHTGVTTIEAGATLKASTLDHTSGVVADGDYNISGTGLADISTLSGSGTVTLGNNTLFLTAASGTFAGVIQGTGTLFVESGTETLTGTNTYAGQTVISAPATLQLSGDGTIENSSVVTVDGQFDATASNNAVTLLSLGGANTGVVTLGANALTLANASSTFAGAIFGTGDLRVTGGTQTLSGDNQYTGATTIGSGATLALAGSGAIESSSGVTVNGSFDVSGLAGSASIANLFGVGTVSLGGNTLEVDNATGTFFGSIGGTGGLTVSAGTQALTGNNTYSGLTTIVFGATLSLNDSGSLAASTVAVGGTFDISDHNGGAAVAGLAGGGTGLVDLGNNSLNITNASSTFAGEITGIGGLTVSGGTQTLSGIIAYTGDTTINGGTLQVETDVTTSSGVTVNNGGTLAGGGTTGNVTVNAGGTLGPGSSTDILFTDSVGFQSGATFSVELDGTAVGTEYDQLNVTGTVNLGGATLETTLGFAPTAGDQFIIIDNDGAADPIQGTFAGLPQGAEFQIGNRFFVISYTGGDGNDVVLTAAGAIISGTQAADIINAATAPVGQPFATDFRDVINGLGGNDNIMGLDGDDTLNGGTGADILLGGGGDDALTGGRGRDTMFGDAGSNVFDFNSIRDSVAGSQRDRLLDFQRGPDDIDLHTIDAKSGVKGNQTFKWIGKQDFHDQKGELRYKDLGSKVIVQGDTNGDGKADFEILVKVGALSANDFTL